MNNFDFAHKFTSKWEGGFVNHPNDPGGATNFGVSLRWLKNESIDIDNDGKIDINDIRKLTSEMAAELFKKEFWDKSKCDQLPKYVALVTYDAAVNVGRTQAIKFLQRACNDLYIGDQLVVDGIIGNKTLSRVKDLVDDIQLNDFVLATLCIDFRTKFHQELADNSPYSDGRDYRPFINGWLNRIKALEKYIQ